MFHEFAESALLRSLWGTSGITFWVTLGVFGFLGALLGITWWPQERQKSKKGVKNRGLKSALVPCGFKMMPKGAPDLQNGAPRLQNGTQKIEKTKHQRATLAVARTSCNRQGCKNFLL